MWIWWISRWQEYELSKDVFQKQPREKLLTKVLNEDSVLLSWQSGGNVVSKVPRPVPTKASNAPALGNSGKAHVVLEHGRALFRSRVRHQGKDGCRLEFSKAITPWNYFTIVKPSVVLPFSLATCGHCPPCPFFVALQTSHSSSAFQRLLAFVPHYVTCIRWPLSLKPPGKFCWLGCTSNRGNDTGLASSCLHVPHSVFVPYVPSSRNTFTWPNFIHPSGPNSNVQW